MAQFSGEAHLYHEPNYPLCCQNGFRDYHLDQVTALTLSITFCKECAILRIPCFHEYCNGGKTIPINHCKIYCPMLARNVSSWKSL